MIALDSSVVVAGFASWSERHEAAVAVLEARPRLVAHAALEAFSVLTRLPQPHRAEPGIVRAYLADQFPETWLTLSASRHRRFVETCAESAITGGAVYDALIASTAGAHGASLASCDRRAAAIYRAIDVEVVPVGWSPAG